VSLALDWLELTKLMPSHLHSDTTNKINLVCDLIRTELEKGDVFHYANTILTAHVRKQPQDYESALKVLVELKAKDSARAEDAVKYIIFLSDANKLFDLALGMYDFPLVLMIAQHSQKVRSPFLSPSSNPLTDLYPPHRILVNISPSSASSASSIPTSNAIASTTISAATTRRFATSLSPAQTALRRLSLTPSSTISSPLRCRRSRRTRRSTRCVFELSPVDEPRLLTRPNAADHPLRQRRVPR